MPDHTLAVKNAVQDARMQGGGQRREVDDLSSSFRETIALLAGKPQFSGH